MEPETPRSPKRKIVRRVLAIWLIVFIAGSGWLLWDRISGSKEIPNNERAARNALHAIFSAEGEFRWHDPDGNNVKDFWTGDVAGLFRYGMILRESAEADTAPLSPLVPKPVPYHGYYFRALVTDNLQTPPVPYAQVTDPASGKVHNLSRFGFVAYPAEVGKTGRYFFILNEAGTLLRKSAEGTPPIDYPTEGELLQQYSHFE